MQSKMTRWGPRLLAKLPTLAERGLGCNSALRNLSHTAGRGCGVLVHEHGSRRASSGQVRYYLSARASTPHPLAMLCCAKKLSELDARGTCSWNWLEGASRDCTGREEGKKGSKGPFLYHFLLPFIDVLKYFLGRLCIVSGIDVLWQRKASEAEERAPSRRGPYGELGRV